jgi:16S rRNA (adenine1518-N6/adenine1519-N6)-dimethyltransferase
MTSTGSSSPPSATPDGPGRVPHRLAEVAATLDRLGVLPRKVRGQSFLLDGFLADAEAALVGTTPAGRVVEIGGGLGILTEALLRRGIAPLTVIEQEPAFAAFLGRTFGARIEIVCADALTTPLPPARAVVGNLPFSVATPILERLWDAKVPRVVALLQREVAERLAAGPGSRTYGRLSILAALHGSVELFQSVPSSAFFPAPAVEGRLVVFTHREGPLPVRSVARLEVLLHALFSARRKQLGNLLPRLVPDRAVAESVAQQALWPEGWARMRPEELAPEAFFRLADVLEARTGARGARRMPPSH